MFGVELKIIGPDGKELPRDGKAFGRLLVRGPWVASGYYKEEDRSAWVDGWFDTGDVATIDETGTMAIVDRSKDVIKSGGEWISSVELENLRRGAPLRGRMRRYRRAASQVGRAAHPARGHEGRQGGKPRRSCWRSSKARSPNGGCPTR